MARGNAPQARVHYQGSDEDFIVLVDSLEEVKKWRSDKTIALANVVSSFDVFVTGKQGDQGILNRASHGTLENEFGTHKEDDVVQQILEKGLLKESDAQERSGSTNDSKGSRAGH